MSPAARMLAFVLLLVAMFAGAYAVGARLGPIRLAHPQQQPGAHMHMPMGAAATPMTTAAWPAGTRD